MFRKLVLVFIGLSSGGIIAAGVFAFLVMIGVFPRLIRKDWNKEAYFVVRNGYHDRRCAGKYCGSV